MSFLALFVTLPTKAATGRMRVWRAQKALGCATLRDGVYLLPDTPAHAAALAEVAGEATGAEGTAEIYCLCGCDEAQDAALRALFDRAGDYAGIAADAAALRAQVGSLDPAAASRRLQPLARRFEQVSRVDFFPGEAQPQTMRILDDLREVLTRRLSPDEPSSRQGDVPRLDPADYRARTWATRARPWVDRLACAWLIRRRIDPEARIVWLAGPADCRPGWLGFDFDGATFTHVGGRVTFETLLAAFGLDADPALARVGALVHCLDVGGLPVPEAAGVEALLAGLRASGGDDDALLARACDLFDWLSQSYQETIP